MRRSAVLFLVNTDAQVFETAGYAVAASMSDANTAIVRLAAPYETLHPGYFFGAKQHEGRLDFDKDGDELNLLRSLKAQGIRTIVDVSLDRPAILTDVVKYADVLTVNFGSTDQALLNVLDGSEQPIGRLPFELPSSMENVRQQLSGRPSDSNEPLFPIGFGLSTSRNQ